MQRMIRKETSFLYNTITFTEEQYNEFKKRLFLALQKHRSSRKTKVVHQIIENDCFEVVLFTGSDDIAIVKAKENRFFKVYLNAMYFADYASTEILEIYVKLMKIIEKMTEEEKIISDQRIYNINKLKADYEIWIKKFLDAFDYSKILDGLYYGFLRFLFNRVYQSNIMMTKKFLLLNSQYLSKFIQYVYKKSVRMNPDDALKEKINIIMDYFILTYYFGDNVAIALKKIEKAYGKDAAEFLRKSNHLKIENFDNLADILFETDTIKIQKNVFDMFFKKEFGEIGFTLLKNNKSDFDAFICSLNHSNILFNAISVDEKLSFQIEELILNEKSKIIFVQQIKKFL